MQKSLFTVFIVSAVVALGGAGVWLATDTNSTAAWLVLGFVGLTSLAVGAVFLDARRRGISPWKSGTQREAEEQGGV